jgi:hypothetical protein
VIGEPPLLGAVHDRETCLLPAVADSPVGVPGVVRGVVVAVPDQAPAPATFLALTWNS